MKTRLSTAFSLSLMAILSIISIPSAAQAQAKADSPSPTALVHDQAKIEAAFHKTPAMFVENVGQFAENARFQVRGGNGTIWLTDNALWVSIVAVPVTEPMADRLASPGSASLAVRSPAAPQRVVNLRTSFPGANPTPRLEPFNRLETHISYFIGKDAMQWHADVPVWGGVRYVDLYPGIDLEISGEGGQLALHMVAHDGANLNFVGLHVDGASAMTVEGDHLRLTTAVGEYTLPLLQVTRTEVAELPSPTVTGDHIASPFVNSPDATVTTVKPLSSSDLLYSTFVGGSADEYGWAIAVDSDGMAYVTGYTMSSGFPTTPGVVDRTYNGGWDAFVVKVNETGSGLVYATFLGGTERDWSRAIAVDSDGNAYVTGATGSTDFPTTPGVVDGSSDEESWDAFVVKMNETGTALVYAARFGGANRDLGTSIVVDSTGCTYVTGNTFSAGFPTTPDAFDQTLNGSSDVFVVKVNATGSDLLYATLIGGVDDDMGFAIGVDSDGMAYITGTTSSADFPTTSGAFDPIHNNGDDGFVVKVNATGSGLTYASFLGGNAIDFGFGISVDSRGMAYIAGDTTSTDFPTTPGAYDRRFDGGEDGFVVKVNSTGSELVYATYLGGNGTDVTGAIAVDSEGMAYVTGWTESVDFPTTPDAFNRGFSWGVVDGFVVQVDQTGSGLVYATFLGGTGSDWGEAIAIDFDGVMYVTGRSESTDFPTTSGAFDQTYSRGGDSYVTKLDKLFSLYLPATVR